MDPQNDVIFIAGGSSGGGGSDILVGALVAGAAWTAWWATSCSGWPPRRKGSIRSTSFADSPDLQGGS